VYQDLTPIWTLDLFLVHNVVASQTSFCVSLNPAAYTPMEIREKHANIIIKFRPEDSVPEAIFKVEEPKGFSCMSED
jgi:hypothetical protein